MKRFRAILRPRFRVSKHLKRNHAICLVTLSTWHDMNFTDWLCSWCGSIFFTMFGLIFSYFLHTKNKCSSLSYIPGQNGQWLPCGTSLLAYRFLCTLRLLIPSLIWTKQSLKHFCFIQSKYISAFRAVLNSRHSDRTGCSHSIQPPSPGSLYLSVSVWRFEWSVVRRLHLASATHNQNLFHATVVWVLSPSCTFHRCPGTPAFDRPGTECGSHPCGAA